MSKKKIEPTQAMVDIVDLADKLMVMDTRDLLRTALNHPDAPGLLAAEWKANAEAAAERAEHAEDLLVDSVHVDEAARRVEAAREQGWDQATRWIDSYQGGPNGRTTSARSANPYRPALTLPTEDGAVIVPAEGHEYITATVFGETWRTREAILSYSGSWNAVWRSGGHARVAVRAEHITPGTWKVDDQ